MLAKTDSQTLMKNHHGLHAQVTILVCVLYTLAGCSPVSIDRLNNAFSYCSESNPSSFNPQLDTSSTTADASAHLLYDRLLEFNPDNGRIVPGLASSWKISNDGLVYTFQLRRGVTFHSTDFFTPSRNFNADDVVFSINRWLEPEHPYHEVNGGNYPYFESLGLGSRIQHVKRINGYRIEITLYEPDSAFLANLATDFAVVLSAEYAGYLQQKGTPSHIDRKPIGTGPYQFVSFRQNQHIRYRKHQGYFLPNDGPEQIVYDITQRSSVRMAKLITGECDAVAFPSQSDLSVIEERSDLALLEKPGLNIGYLAFNTQKPPLDDPMVRRAIGLAIDKTSILDAVYLGQAIRAKSLVPSTSWAYESNAKELGYNPVRAREILDNIGLPSDFELNIWAIPVRRAYNPDAQKMAQLIQRYLSEVGIRSNIISQDWNLFRQNLAVGEHDVVLIGWNADNGDPDNFYRPLLSCDAIPFGTNRAMWCNQEYDKLIEMALLSTDLDERRLIYHQANKIVFNEYPIMPIAHAFQYQAFRHDIEGMQINPFGSIRLDNVRRQSREGTDRVQN